VKRVKASIFKDPKDGSRSKDTYRRYYRHHRGETKSKGQLMSQISRVDVANTSRFKHTDVAVKVEKKNPEEHDDFTAQSKGPLYEQLRKQICSWLLEKNACKEPFIAPISICSFCL
jgi:hypothetical protein